MHALRNLALLAPSIFMIFFCSAVNAQGGEKAAKAERANYFSKRYKLTVAESEDLVQLMSRTTEAMNNIFRDSTLSSTQKLEKLQLLEKIRTNKFREFLSDKVEFLNSKKNLYKRLNK